jgi:tetratricopeptide (TPR) repeat protein
LELGYLYSRIGNYDNAIKNFKKANEINPTFEEIISFYLGIYFRNTGKYEEAEEKFMKALQLSKDPTMYFYYIGSVYFYKGDLDSALYELNKVIREKKEIERLVFSYSLEVLIFKEQNNEEGLNYILSLSEEYLKTKIQQEPENSFYYVELARIYCDAETKKEEALILAEKAIEIDKKPKNYYVLGRACLLNGKIDEAIKNFEKVLEYQTDFQDINIIWTLHWLGKVYKDYKNNFVKAKEYFDKCLKINPNFRFTLSEIESLK